MRCFVNRCPIGCSQQQLALCGQCEAHTEEGGLQQQFVGGRDVSVLVHAHCLATHLFFYYPNLLATQGTTTNGRYLLPFKTGAFIAGVPLQPVLMHYDMKVREGR